MMTRQYVQRSNQSHRQAVDSRILQRTAVRSIPVTTVQTEPQAEDKPRLKMDLMQILVRNQQHDRHGPEGDRMASREDGQIGETVGRSPLFPAQFPYSYPVLPIQAKLTIHEMKSEAGRTDRETPVQPMAVDQKAENKTGLPDRLKEGLESLSGYDLSGVSVNYNSAKPAQLNALAYTQGQTIEVGPGKERHLPHEAWHVVQQMQGRVRPTLEVNGYGVNDDRNLEHEADVMGHRAMQMRSSGEQLMAKEKQESPEEESREASPESQTSDRPEAAPPFQTKTAPSPIQTQEGGAISPELEASIQQAKGSGSSLQKPLRSKMEQAFGGSDFSGVKIHTGMESDRLNRSIQARAFTSGRDIFFRQGEYRPESEESQQLIAHELVHVEQQNPECIQRSPGGEEDFDPYSANRYRDRLREKAQEMYRKERGQGSGENRSSSDQQAIAPRGRNSRDSTERSSNKKDLIQEGASDGDILQKVLQIGRLERDPKVAGQAIGKRFPKGPLLSDEEFMAINILSRSQEGNLWLEAAGMYNINQAKQYLTAHNYRNWLKLEPANRVLLAHLAWRLPNVVALKEEQVKDTPPYRLGRSMDVKDESRDSERRAEAKEAIDRDLRQEWIKTLKGKELNEDARKAIEDYGMVRKEGKKKGSPLSLSEVEQQHPRATEILNAVLILLQAGLQVYDEWRGEHADYEGSVIRALSHGGRVNVRIPALKNKQENPYALTDWLGITENKKVEKSGAAFGRSFGTHHMAIGKNIDREPGTGTFREEGGSKAALKNIGNTKLYGMNLAVGGIGERDFNGDVILPDGAHGHMFIGFKPPTIERDGALQIGIETTAPGGASTVGYHHGPKSSEATANPESSFGGLKADKVGYGSPAKAALIKGKKLDDATTNARMVDLNKIDNGKWLEYLSYLKNVFDIIKKENIEEYYSLLVGPRSQASLEDAIFRLTGESLV